MTTTTEFISYEIPIIPILVPVVLGFAMLWLCRRNPALGAHPVRTALALFVLLDVLNAIVTPVGDLVSPTVGGIVLVVVCVAVYISLRRRHGGGVAR
jgi:hypothetical protein